MPAIKKMMPFTKQFFKFLGVILLFFNTAKGQESNISGKVQIPSPKYNVIDFGTSNINVYFKVTFSPDPLVIERKREAICVLQIGDHISKFVDDKLLKKDSLVYKMSLQPEINNQDLNEFLKIRENWESTVLKLSIKDSVIVQTYIRSLYEYGEIQPKFNWKLEADSKKILGYNCKKATMSFRGRTYIAWYAQSLPNSEGPYIFKGLPGLILEISDNQNNFLFTAIGINEKPSMIYWHNEKNIFKIDRSKFKTVEKSYYDNPGFFHGRAYNEDGTIIKSKPLPYNPIEKDDVWVR